MLSKLQQKKDEGFTIIEVLIVLAIAGLILVIVLVAVPQLQRNQRNEARRADAARVGTAVSNWSSNNNGKVFEATSLEAMLKDLGDVSQYELAADPAANNFMPTANITVATGAVAAFGTAADDIAKVRIVTKAKCGVDGAAEASAASRQFVVQFATETSANLPQGQCIDV